MKYKLLRFSLLSLLVMLCGNVFADEVTMAYTGTTTTNMTGENDAALFGLDATEWNVIADKGSASNLPGLNKAGDFRLYYADNGGSTITVQCLSSIINSIAITYTGEGYSNAYVAVNGEKVEGKDGVYTIGGRAFVIGNANTTNVQVRIKQIVINYGASSDTRTATTMTLSSDYPTSGAVGERLELPSPIIKAGETTLSVDYTWSSSDESIAVYDNGKVLLKKAGTTTMKATYAGDATYQPCSASYTLTVKDYTVYTSIADMLENITSTKTDVKFSFTGLSVTYVNGLYTYVHKNGDGDILLYGANLGLEKDCLYNGSLVGQLYSYNGLPEIAIASAADIKAEKQDGMVMVSTTIITLDQLPYYINKMCAIQNAEYVKASSKSLTFKVGDTEFTAYNNFGLSTDGLTAGKKYTIEGFGAVYTKNESTTYQIYPTKFTEEQEEAPATFKDFAAIVNNQEGTLLGDDELVQGTSIYFGVAVDAEGNTIRVAADAASAIATISGKYHSDHGLTNMQVLVKVPGPVKILVGQCTYSSKNINVIDATGKVVASVTPATACWKNDRNNVTEIIYDGEATTLSISGMDYCPFVAVKEYVAPAEFKDFAVIVNNQEGTLLAADEQVQGTAVEFGVAVDAEGNTIRVAKDDAKSIATVSGKYHSDHGMTGLNVRTAVPGPVKILVGQCTYSSKNINVIDATGNVVASVTPATACWKNDRNNVTEIIYNGEATTLSISGMDYCPFIAVQKYEATPDPQPEDKDITGTWDFSNQDIMSAVMGSSGSAQTEEVEAMEKNGLKMIIEAHGAAFRNNGNNIQVATGAVFKIPVKNAGDLVTVKGYPGYSKYTIGNSTEVLTDENTYKAKASDAEAGYVAVTSADGNNYYYLLSVTQYAKKAKVTLDNEPATAHFAFNEGTEGQTATLSNADYFLNTKVSHGTGVILEGKDNKGLNQTWFNVAAKDASATEDNAIRFLITPKPGFTFTPTKASFKTTRFGTNGGKLDIAWQNTDGTTAELASGIQPVRDNATPNVSELVYEIAGATAGEGTCGLKINLYSLDPNKHVGFSEIIIEGTLSGTEKDLPILASFKINEKEYAVEDVFGDEYEATLKLSKAEAMVSAENPLTDLTATSGEIGTVTYEGTETSCKVTIPMTAGETQMNYVLNIIQKPDYKLSYIAVDGTTVLTEQIVEEDGTIGEFAYDIADVAATKDGYKARGWFKQNYLGEKFATTDVIKGNTNLYALETEIEVPSNSRKYVYDLTNQFFYAEDHEGFNSIGSGYWHDKQHGWAFNNGDKIELLVGPKATINFSLCQYSKEGATIEGSNGASISAVAESDGGAGSFDYEGEAGTLTLTINSQGAVYIHSITVFNTTETNYAKQGDWIIVKKGNASSLLDAIEVAKGIENAKIFLPDGTYDLGEAVKTIISGKNVSLIGQSAEKTIITTRPPKEGLDVADLLKNTGEGLYMQDLTLKNDFAYSGNDGRAASLHDTGTKTVCKNVILLSHQDTYYSHKVGGLYYWEGGELHGTVDYLCGNGKVYYNEVKLVNEKRNSSTITANSELYVFNNCTVENNADTYNFGRAWSDNPTCIYLNTTLLDGGEKLISTRWNLNGLNCDYSVAGEYGTKDANGNDITPESNVVTFTKKNTTMNTILSAEMAARYSIENVLGEWAATAKLEATQLAAPEATYENGQVKWTPANDGAIAYALFKNGEFVGITESSSFTIEAAATDILTIRAANTRGGFGEAAIVDLTTVGIDRINTTTAGSTIYNLSGQRVQKAQKGLYIINGKKHVVK